MLGENWEIGGLEELDFHEELPERQKTLEGNSLEKAEYLYKKFKVNCFADDTGLEVHALDGAPGVYSARYAGPQKNNEENIDLLLEKLRGKSSRKAQFRTVITLVLNGKTRQFEGLIKGAIARERKGSQGFGYDAIFVPEGYAKSFAEMSLQEKNQISHRAKAVQKLVAFLKKKEKPL